MANWHTVLAEGSRGVAAAAQLAMRGYEVRLLCSEWDPFDYATQGPGLDLFWMDEEKVASVEPILGPLVPARHCDIFLTPFSGIDVKDRPCWAPVLDRKGRLELQMGLILEASGDVCADVCVEQFESDAGRVSACMLDTGRHHIGTRLWVDASPRRVRRWGQSFLDLAVGDYIERVEIQLTYPTPKYRHASEIRHVPGVEIQLSSPGLWPGLSGWVNFETAILRCPRRHRLTLLSAQNLYATVQDALGLEESTDTAQIFTDVRPVDMPMLQGTWDAYQSRLHSVGIESIHSDWITGGASGR